MTTIEVTQSLKALRIAKETIVRANRYNYECELAYMTLCDELFKELTKLELLKDHT